MAIGSYAIGAAPSGGVPRRFIVIIPSIGVLSLGHILESPGRDRSLEHAPMERVLGSEYRVRTLVSSGESR